MRLGAAALAMAIEPSGPHAQFLPNTGRDGIGAGVSLLCDDEPRSGVADVSSALAGTPEPLAR